MNEELLKYLDNEMTPAERQALEERLQREPVLQEQLDRLRLARQAVRFYGTHEEVAAVHKTFMEERSAAPVVKMKSRTRPMLLAAACLIFVLLGSGGLYLYGLNADKVYRDAFVDYTVSGTRGAGNGLSVVEQPYGSKQHKVVLGPANDTNRKATASLLIGLAYLKDGQADDAIAVFRPMLSQPTAYRADAEFYLSLSYLKAHRYDEALQLMKRIHDQPDHLYHSYVTSGLIWKTKMLRWK